MSDEEEAVVLEEFVADEEEEEEEVEVKKAPKKVSPIKTSQAKTTPKTKTTTPILKVPVKPRIMKTETKDELRFKLAKEGERVQELLRQLNTKKSAEVEEEDEEEEGPEPHFLSKFQPTLTDVLDIFGAHGIENEFIAYTYVTSGVRKGFQPVFANKSNVLCTCDPDSMKMDELSEAQLDKLFFGVPLDEDELLRLINETGRNLLFRGETMKTAKPKRAGLRGMSRASPVSYK